MFLKICGTDVHMSAQWGPLICEPFANQFHFRKHEICFINLGVTSSVVVNSVHVSTMKPIPMCITRVPSSERTKWSLMLTVRSFFVPCKGRALLIQKAQVAFSGPLPICCQFTLSRHSLLPINICRHWRLRKWRSWRARHCRPTRSGHIWMGSAGTHQL